MVAVFLIIPENHASLRVFVQKVRPPLREDTEVLRSSDKKVSRVRRRGRTGHLRSGSAVQRLGLVCNGLREEAVWRVVFWNFVREQWRFIKGRNEIGI